MKSLEIKWKRNEERLLAFNSKHSQDVLKPKGLKTVTEQNTDPTFNYLHRFNDNAWLVKCEAVPNPRPFEEKQTVNFFFLERFPKTTQRILQNEKLKKNYEKTDSEAVALGLPTFNEIGAFHYYRVSYSMVFDLWALKPNTFKENVQSFGMSQNPDLAKGNSSSSPAETVLTNFPSSGVPSASFELYQPAAIKQLFETKLSEKLTNLYNKLPKWLVFIVRDDSAPVPILFFTGKDLAPDFGMVNRQENLACFFDILISDNKFPENYIRLNDLTQSLISSNPNNPMNYSSLSYDKALELIQKKPMKARDNAQFSNHPYISNYLSTKGKKIPFGKTKKVEEGILITITDQIFPPFGFQVFWPTGKYRIGDLNSGKEDLDQKAHDLALFLEMFPEVKVEIRASTDNVGSEESNLSLSQKRADAIKSYLENEFGISSSKIKAIGDGEAKANENYNGLETSDEKYRRVYLIYR